MLLSERERPGAFWVLLFWVFLFWVFLFWVVLFWVVLFWMVLFWMVLSGWSPEVVESHDSTPERSAITILEA